MVRKGIMTLLVICCAAFFTGCVAARHAADTQEGLQGDKLTVGTVQKEIKKGMSGAEVAAALGSPNIVTTDEQGREVWIYDKISTAACVQPQAAASGTKLADPRRASVRQSRHPAYGGRMRSNHAVDYGPLQVQTCVKPDGGQYTTLPYWPHGAVLWMKVPTHIEAGPSRDRDGRGLTVQAVCWAASKGWDHLYGGVDCVVRPATVSVGNKTRDLFWPVRLPKRKELVTKVVVFKLS